jgi:hypothetical protein
MRSICVPVQIVIDEDSVERGMSSVNPTAEQPANPRSLTDDTRLRARIHALILQIFCPVLQIQEPHGVRRHAPVCRPCCRGPWCRGPGVEAILGGGIDRRDSLG